MREEIRTVATTTPGRNVRDPVLSKYGVWLLLDDEGDDHAGFEVTG